MLYMKILVCTIMSGFHKSGHIFVCSIPRRMFSYVVWGHYPVTNSNGTHLKLNYDFNCCKTVVFKILQSLKGYLAIIHDATDWWAFYNLYIHLTIEWMLAKLSSILDSFYWHSQHHYHSYRVEWWGQVGSHEVVGKAYIFTKNSQMASISITQSS